MKSCVILPGTLIIPFSSIPILYTLPMCQSLKLPRINYHFAPLAFKRPAFCPTIAPPCRSSNAGNVCMPMRTEAFFQSEKGEGSCLHKTKIAKIAKNL